MWPFTRAQPQNRAPVPTDAQEALDRAYEALVESEITLQETQNETQKITRELETNHFGPLIYAAMGWRKSK